MNRDRIIVIFSFALIFMFSSIDNSISPMVEILHKFYSVPMQSVILLISYCTFGIIAGVFVGPSMTSSFDAGKVVLASSLGMCVSLALFLLTADFYIAAACRFIFGLFLGVAASSMWWIAYYGVSKHYYPSMVVVLMAARPLALALGVPAAGFMASNYAWQWPFFIFGALILYSGSVLFGSIKDSNEPPKQRLDFKKVFTGYYDAFKVPYLPGFYLGLTLNRMCYFGFYSFMGLWFVRHYGVGVAVISKALLFIGLAETLVNFIVPRLIKIFGNKNLFTLSIISSGFVFAAFIGGRFSLVPTVSLIALFMVLDRLYMVTAVISIPEMFASASNKTIFGSLNTLTAWAGLAVISWVQGRFTEAMGLALIEYALLASFIAGSAMMYYVQHKTVFSVKKA
ncbi:MAG TPA: MFS transporter [Candidatus Wallbacteria bacterium]|nr:MAG: Major Facilitator Superfamily protein [bacterium ADurb.Bin243]HPG57068.1 MFS transporter [Candidatus Wallbacteria bacterium]